MPPRMGLKHRLSIQRGFLTTALGLESRGFFVPYRYAGVAERRVQGYPAVERLFAGRAPEMASFIDETVHGQLDALAALDDPPRWRSRFFSPRDAAVAYAMVRSLRPRAILEIGAGNSTWFMANAIRDAGLDCTLTCIDPVPRSDIGGLPVAHVARPLSPADAAFAASLGPGDILFVDSSHILLPGMDVDIEFNLMFPELAPGVIVHVHDVFLPDGYPSHWARRMFSEQNALVGWLVSGFFEPLFAGHYATTRLGESWAALAQGFAPLGRPQAGSLWLRRAESLTAAAP